MGSSQIKLPLVARQRFIDAREGRARHSVRAATGNGQTARRGLTRPTYLNDWFMATMRDLEIAGGFP
jgi:hypothetical protein